MKNVEWSKNTHTLNWSKEIYDQIDTYGFRMDDETISKASGHQITILSTNGENNEHPWTGKTQSSLVFIMQHLKWGWVKETLMEEFPLVSKNTTKTHPIFPNLNILTIPQDWIDGTMNTGI